MEEKFRFDSIEEALEDYKASKPSSFSCFKVIDLPTITFLKNLEV